MADFDIDGTDSVICPHCGSDNGAEEFHTPQRATCSECEKEFWVQPDYSVTYSTSCVDHAWPEEWKPVKNQDGWFSQCCTVCGSMRVKEKDERHENRH